MKYLKFLKKKVMKIKKKDKKEKKKLKKLNLNNGLEAKKVMKYSNTLLSSVFIPDELLAEILSFLDVKNIVQLKCVSKSWNNLISDPTFVEKHLKKSSQKPHFILTPSCLKYPISSVKSFPVHRLLKNPTEIIGFPLRGYNSSNYPIGSESKVVNSCNGLLCLLLSSLRNYHIRNFSFYLWNPSTRKRSAKFGTFDQAHKPRPRLDSLEFTFGCDIVNGTYKVVAFHAERDEYGDSSWRGQVRVLSLGDNCWRTINTIPFIPLISPYNNGVHLSGTISWLALRKHLSPFYEYTVIDHVEQFVIVSLDLSTETYTEFLLPSGFDDVPHFQPTLNVLMDHLCFSHDYYFKRTEFVIWQMKEFGVQDSWSQIFRIDCNNLDMRIPFPCGAPLFLPLYLSNNGDTLILADCDGDQTIIYNHRESRVKRISSSNKVCQFSHVESLVSTHLMTPSTFSVHGTMVGKMKGKRKELC